MNMNCDTARIRIIIQTSFNSLSDIYEQLHIGGWCDGCLGTWGGTTLGPSLLVSIITSVEDMEVALKKVTKMLRKETKKLESIQIFRCLSYMFQS